MGISQVIDFRIRCDHPGCGQQRFLTAATREQAIQRAVGYGWRGDAQHIECPKHHEGT